MANPFPKPARQNIPLVDLSHLTVVRRGIAGIVVEQVRESSELRGESILFSLTPLPEIPPSHRCNALVSGKPRTSIPGECGALLRG